MNHNTPISSFPGDDLGGHDDPVEPNPLVSCIMFEDTNEILQFEKHLPDEGIDDLLKQTSDPVLKNEIKSLSYKGVTEYGKVPYRPPTWNPKLGTYRPAKIHDWIRPLGCPEPAPKGFGFILAWRIKGMRWNWNESPLQIAVGKYSCPF